MTTPEDRRRKLVAEFEMIDSNRDNVISKQELIAYLDRRNGGLQFDRLLANELFDRMEKNKDDRVSVNEFINIWNESNAILRRNIQEAETEINIAQDRKTKLINQVGLLQKNRGQPIPSSLRMIVKEVKGVEAEAFVVAVKVGGQMRQTSNIPRGNPNIGQYLEFPLPRNGAQAAQFSLLDTASPNRPPLQGLLPLAILDDQLKHDEWVILERQDGMRSDARIFVSIQHIWSEADYFTNLVAHWDQYIRQKQAEIAKNEAYLQQIAVPNDFLMTVAHGDFYIKRLKPTQEFGTYHETDTAYMNTFAQNPSRIHPMSALALLFGLVLMIACLVLMFYRSMAVALLLIGWFYLDLNFTTMGVFIVAGLSIVAIIIDIVWLVEYQSAFWSTQYIDSNSLKGGRKVEVIGQYIVLGLKVLILLLLVRLYQITKRKNFSQGKPIQALNSNQYGPGYIPMSTNYYRPGSLQYNGFPVLNEGFFIERPPNFNGQPGAMAGPPGAPQPGLQGPVRGPALGPGGVMMPMNGPPQGVSISSMGQHPVIAVSQVSTR